EESRKRMLEHLWEKCQIQESYKPKKLQELSAEISEFMERKIESKRKLAEKEEKKRKKLEEASKQTSTVEDSENIFLDIKDDEVESIMEKEEQQTDSNQNSSR